MTDSHPIAHDSYAFSEDPLACTCSSTRFVFLASEIDQLLSSKILFPSLQKLCVAVIHTFKMPDVTVKEGCEQGLKRWFPTLNETGHLAVEWDAI